MFSSQKDTRLTGCIDFHKIIKPVINSTEISLEEKKDVLNGFIAVLFHSPLGQIAKLLISLSLKSKLHDSKIRPRPPIQR